MPDPLASIEKAAYRYVEELRAVLTAAVDQANGLLYDEMRLLIGRIDHTLKQLKEEGHPYRADGTPGDPHPDWIVHIQDGKLLAGLRKLPATVNSHTIEGVILSQSPYTWYLLLGTRKMRPRDFVSAAIILRRPEIAAILTRAFLSVHDRVVGSEPSLEVNLLPHAEFPAQLPGGF